MCLGLHHRQMDNPISMHSRADPKRWVCTWICTIGRGSLLFRELAQGTAIDTCPIRGEYLNTKCPFMVEVAWEI